MATKTILKSLKQRV